ncbi:hypothetical protein B7P43_G09039 [Cryptotermes secundus]|uniref:Phosphatidylinositol transfer protein N-terminal domain-containing protein n=1 Tax=Cryptotermes secundus TaxID=105785 RepID=A0A2J7PQ00_9NEOP|nr:hypothetical protein B7P43_G09039 [Cryptotermes secundus]
MATILTNRIGITHLPYEAFSSQMPHIQKKATSKASWSQGQLKVALAAVENKKSREESKGAGSGVEILVNEPYNDGPGGQGQYTHKIYHVGSHLPGWFKSLLPKSALTVEEEAWNAYPYTKTRYTCPFVEKFSLEIETYYYADNGHQENVFGLSGSDLRNRVIGMNEAQLSPIQGHKKVKQARDSVIDQQSR